MRMSRTSAADAAAGAAITPEVVPDGIVRIEGPKEGVLRIRDVVKRSNTRVTLKYPSVKMGRVMQAESQGEYAAFRLLDTDRTTSRFFEQPKVIYFYLDGVLHMHIPDIEVEARGQHLKHFWEIKPLREASDPFVVARTALLTRALPPYGYSYHLHISEELKKHRFLKSADTLIKFGYQPIDARSRELVRRIIAERGFITWSCAKEQFDRSLRAILCHLVLAGFLDFDRTEALTADTRFFLAQA